MGDIYQRDAGTYKAPITADKCTLTWDGVVTAAIQVQISYAQQISRRRSIGNKDMVIFASYPQGQISIARMLCDGANDIFGKGGWNHCQPTEISFNMAGCSGGFNLTANNCVVSQYTVSAEAEGLTVIDNLVIEFLELTK
jgi:hypothetical protein